MPSHQLDAFVTVAQSKSFSEAARRLHITQSALSQRILNLEEDLRITLFLREPHGIRMTEQGESLLRYCRSKNLLEEQFLSGIRLGNENELSGMVRIASFSTHVRSLLLPKLGAFGRAHPGVQIDLFTREVRELPIMLKSGEADFIFTDHPIEKQEVENRLVAQEDYVLIESRNGTSRKDVYIDHDEFDHTTADFFKFQKLPQKQYKRAYFDEIYTIIEAVGEGFGRAVVPLHLIQGNKRVSVVKNLRPLKSPVYLSHFKQAFYTVLQLKLISLLSHSDH